MTSQTKPRLTSLAPQFLVDDLERSIAYYQRVLITGAPLGAVFAQQSQTNFAPLEKAALDELHESNTPGAAVAVVSGDRIVYVKGFGLSNVETGTPVEPEMLFRTG